MGVKGSPLTLALLAAGPLHVGRRRACWALRGRAGDGLALHRAVLVKTGHKQDVKQGRIKQKAALARLKPTDIAMEFQRRWR